MLVPGGRDGAAVFALALVGEVVAFEVVREVVAVGTECAVRVARASMLVAVVVAVARRVRMSVVSVRMRMRARKLVLVPSQSPRPSCLSLSLTHTQSDNILPIQVLSDGAH